MTVTIFGTSIANQGTFEASNGGTLFVTNKSTQAGTGEVLRIELTD